MVGTNLLLSGDNAVVIAMASRRLPQELRRRAIIWGATGAVVLRIAFAAVVTFLLTVPLLRLVGGLILFWISWQLVNSNAEGPEVQAGTSVWSAVRVIIVADAVMSLDNVIALVGVSGGNLWLLGVGVLLTIPLVIWGSALLGKLLDRFPILVYAGAALLVWIALEMILEDRILRDLLTSLPEDFDLIVRAVGTLLFVAVVWLFSRRSSKPA